MSKVTKFPNKPEQVELLSHYEVVRDGKLQLVARMDLTLAERHQVAARLRREGEADLEHAEELRKYLEAREVAGCYDADGNPRPAA